jgi:hypothetical protein
MYEIDKCTGKALEFVYVPCKIKKGSNIYRYNDNILNVYIPSSIIVNNLLKDYSDIFKPLQIGNGEATLLFNESDIEKVAVILKAKTYGKNKSPKPKIKRNFSEEQKRIAGERLKLMHEQKSYGRKS